MKRIILLTILILVSSLTVNIIGDVQATTGVGIIAVVNYVPSGVSTYSISSSTFADVDNTNVKITFTAPTNGKVNIRVVGFTDESTATAYQWRLYDGSSVIGTATTITKCDSGTNTITEFYVTGLTGGNSYTWRLQHARITSGTGRIIYGAGTIPTQDYPVVIIAEAIP